MEQDVWPCCGKHLTEDDVWKAIDDYDDEFGTTTKTVLCPHCKKTCNVFMCVESVEVEDEEVEDNEKDV